MKQLVIGLAILATARGGHADPAVPSLPPIADVATISLEQKQGGPSMLRCDGIVYSVTIDLVANTWKSAWCIIPPTTPGKPGKPANTVVRQPKTGKVAKDAREKLVAAYNKMTTKAVVGGGNDGGTLTLTVTKTDKTSLEFIDQNWGDKKPPLPPIAVGIKELATAAAMIAPP